MQLKICIFVLKHTKRGISRKTSTPNPPGLINWILAIMQNSSTWEVRQLIAKKVGWAKLGQISKPRQDGSLFSTTNPALPPSRFMQLKQHQPGRPGGGLKDFALMTLVGSSLKQAIYFF